MEIAKFLTAHDSSKIEDAKPTNTPKLKLEAMKMPEFDGDIRDYPRFKKDFELRVIPSVGSSDAIPYVLRSCLKRVPLEIVKNVDDDVSEMWKRLDEKYGEASKLIDVIMDDITKFQRIRDGDNSKFIEFVDTVERGYRDLARLNLEKELSNSYSVSVLEVKLPPSVKLQWSRKINKTNSKVNSADKFPAFLNFLLEEKRVIEYNTSALRNNEDQSHVDGSEYYANEINYALKRENYRCVIHDTNDHFLFECESFLEKTAEQKLEVVKEHKLCWNCLRPNHRATFCRFKTKCEENGCQKFHHKLLHECHENGLNFHVAHNISNQNEDTNGACLLQLMRVNAESKQRGYSMNVMWDGGATISLITFKKANAMHLDGIPVKLNVVKVGGTTEEIDSYKYDINLVDKSGKIHSVTLYGISKISNNIKVIDISAVSKVFSGITEREIRRPCGEIDALIGFEYAGYHPIRIQIDGHLALLENAFGKCLGGRHPMLKENTRKLIKHAVINHLRGISVETIFETEPKSVKGIESGEIITNNVVTSDANAARKNTSLDRGASNVVFVGISELVHIMSDEAEDVVELVIIQSGKLKSGSVRTDEVVKSSREKERDVETKLDLKANGERDNNLRLGELISMGIFNNDGVLAGEVTPSAIVTTSEVNTDVVRVNSIIPDETEIKNEATCVLERVGDVTADDIESNVEVYAGSIAVNNIAKRLIRTSDVEYSGELMTFDVEAFRNVKLKVLKLDIMGTKYLIAGGIEDIGDFILGELNTSVDFRQVATKDTISNPEVAQDPMFDQLCTNTEVDTGDAKVIHRALYQMVINGDPIGDIEEVSDVTLCEVETAGLGLSNYHPITIGTNNVVAKGKEELIER